MARSEAPAPAKAVGNSYPLRLPPPRQSSTLRREIRDAALLCHRESLHEEPLRRETVTIVGKNVLHDVLHGRLDLLYPPLPTSPGFLQGHRLAHPKPHQSQLFRGLDQDLAISRPYWRRVQNRVIDCPVLVATRQFHVAVRSDYTYRGLRIFSPPPKMVSYSCFTLSKSGAIRWRMAFRPASVNCSCGPAQKRRWLRFVVHLAEDQVEELPERRVLRHPFVAVDEVVATAERGGLDFGIVDSSSSSSSPRG